MSFPSTVYYTIVGKNELLKHPELDPDSAKYLAEPFTYTNTEGFSFSPWMQKDYILLFKLLFLIELHYDNEEFSFVQNAPISENFFDQWWHIYRSEVISNAENAFKRAGLDIKAKIILAGNSRVDAVLQRIGNV